MLESVDPVSSIARASNLPRWCGEEGINDRPLEDLPFKQHMLVYSLSEVAVHTPSLLPHFIDGQTHNLSEDLMFKLGFLHAVPRIEDPMKSPGLLVWRERHG
jgi:hypothetical protein